MVKIVTSNAYRDEGGSLIAERARGYGAAGNVVRRERERRGGQRAVDIFGYNARYELASASLGGTDLYAYAYDAVGNRVSATETTNSWAYAANALNQYTSIVGNNDGTFIPEYDDDGNQTLVKTETGVWRVAYNGENRPVAWSNGTTVVEMSYDDTGRRRAKRVVSPGSEVLHTFLYDGYLLVAESAVSNGVPLTPVNYVWDPAENTATLALCSISGTNVLFHTHDLTKNVWEQLDRAGNIVTKMNYTSCGNLSTGGIETPNSLFWSSEYYDSEVQCSYYNYRHYCNHCAQWTTRDPQGEESDYNLFSYLANQYVSKIDRLGLMPKDGGTKLPAKRGNCSVTYKIERLPGAGARADFGGLSYPQILTGAEGWTECGGQGTSCPKYTVKLSSGGCNRSITFDPTTDPNAEIGGLGKTYLEHELGHIDCSSATVDKMHEMAKEISGLCAKPADINKLVELMRKALGAKERHCQFNHDCVDYKKSDSRKLQQQAVDKCQLSERQRQNYENLINEYRMRLESLREGR